MFNDIFTGVDNIKLLTMLDECKTQQLAFDSQSIYQDLPRLKRVIEINEDHRTSLYLAILITIIIINNNNDDNNNNVA